MKRFLPLIALVLSLVAVLFTLRPVKNRTEFDITGFSKLPSVVNGRIKPLDSVARSTLLVLQGRQRVTTPEGKTIAPAEWLLEVMTRPEVADKMQVFEVVHPDLLALMQLNAEDGAGKKRFSLMQLRPRFEELSRQARLAGQMENPQRTTFQRAVLQLHNNLGLYQRLRFSIQMPDTTDLLAELTAYQERRGPAVEALRAKEAGKPHDEKLAAALVEDTNKFLFIDENALIHPIPPVDGAPPDDWRTIGKALQDSLQDGRIPPEALAYAGLSRSWVRQNAGEFNQGLHLLRAVLDKTRPTVMGKCETEALFNSSEPFYSSSLLYVVGFMVAVFAWLVWPRELARASFWIIVVAFVLSTAGILARMWIEGRPPVTNLYSSALFVGWVAVALCVVIEQIYKNALANMAAGIIGACTLVIAHHLSMGGDTMEMMRAVLDSNFWLATHVVTISIGYGATFLAGIFAVIFIVFGLFTKALTKENADLITRIVYGVVCFATFFSLVGTLLGGIWADQSWGRFWGWDPKENGALVIVVWNAIILHARLGGLVRQRGMMALAVFGNIVTAMSWFGVNMLGVGLHSYGFNDKGAVYLGLFTVSQLLFIGLACLPTTVWRSAPSR